MRSLFILFVLAISANTVYAEDPVYFADANLEAIVRNKLGIPEPDLIYPSDMLSLTYLYANDEGIIDLTTIPACGRN